MKKPMILVMLTVVLMVFAAGCATQKVSRCTAPGDAPQNHYIAGMEALEQNKFDVAQSKFERALFCDEYFSQAYGGLAIIYAYKTAQQRDPDFSSVDRNRTLDYIAKDGKNAKTNEEKFAHLVSVIRVNTWMDGRNWIPKTEDAYKIAKGLSVDGNKILYYQGFESIDYFMGLAYLRAHDYQKARNMFTSVLNAPKGSKWQAYADMAWKKTDRITRAIAGTSLGDLGKRIAVQDAVTRGDFAVLLVDELKIEKLFEGRTPPSQTGKVQQEFTPPDITNYPFKEEVVTVMKWKVRGLEPKYDDASRAYLFKPMDTVKRGEMALVLEDILIKNTGDEKIATAYFGHDKSPFPDVKPTSPLYNAVMNVTTRGIMEGETSGKFRPNDPVSGADAVLAVRVLKHKMNIN
ncbi:MAG: S-layer homology domain-containing protein [Deltaproteobacteria bacterium]